MRQVRHQVARTSSRLVRIGPNQLEGFLTVPEHATGLVIFARGSGSSRLSPRNTFVAEALQLRALDQVARAASDWFALHLRPKQ